MIVVCLAKLGESACRFMESFFDPSHRLILVTSLF